jgi:hypothetical protein
MIALLDNLPDAVLGVEAAGEITRDDYTQTLRPAFEEHLQRYGKVRVLYVLDDDHDFAVGALWEDEKLFDRHPFSFEKVAVVTNAKGVRGLVRAFGWMIPGDVHLFATDEMEQAKDWVAA